jgi:hypothetical protein
MKGDVNNKHISLRLTGGIFVLNSQPFVVRAAICRKRFADPS